VRVTSAAGTRDRRGDPHGQSYVTHLVEVQTPHGSWVIFESEDAKRAHAMAEFARSAVPPRLRIATPAEPAVPAAGIDEETDAADSGRNAAGR